MQAVVRLWLNGDRNYYTGLALLRKFSSDDSLLRSLMSGDTHKNAQQLHRAMLALLEPAPPPQTEAEPVEVKASSPLVESKKSADIEPKNLPLYEAARKEANDAYKEVMNLRAVLFKHTVVEDWENANRPDLVKARAAMAIAVVQGYNKVSQLYDRADHVKRTGRLPEDKGDDLKNEYDNLPDFLVKHTLDNLRKNLKKIRGKKESADRTASIIDHEANIKKLEERWHSLLATTL